MMVCGFKKQETGGHVNLEITLACVGAGISLVGFIQYLNGIMCHGTRPRMASWIAWLTANMIFSIVAFHEQAWLAVAINGVGVVTNILVVIASGIKKVPMKPADAIDWSCLIASIICIGVMVTIPDMKLLAAMLAMVANLVATIPTFRHAWTKPYEETWQLFAACVIANSLGIVSIVLSSGLEMVTLAGPLIATLGNASLLLMTTARKWVVVVEKEVIADVQMIEQQFAPAEREAE